MKKIIVTEKPSVARTFAKVLGVSEKQDGYMENENWIITWCLGHLVTIAEPEAIDPKMKTWSFDTLPFLPEHYRYDVITGDGGRTKKQFNVIKQLYNRSDIDTIYYAGDPAREGLYIQMLVRAKAGHNPNARELVVWIDSQTAPEIRRGIKEAKPLSEYRNLAKAGFMRAIEDYALGMNLSRAMTLKYQNILKHKGAVSIGRVMTCVLGMVVNREREIRNFVPKDFFRVNSTIQVGAGKCTLPWHADHTTRLYPKMEKYIYNDTAFLSESFANNFAEHLDQKVTVTKVEQKIEKKQAPLLFNLAELQALCSRLFKISPDKTLEIVQTLYQEQLTTYPRTDSRYLSSAIAKEIDTNLNGLLSYDDGDIRAAIRSISDPTSIEQTRYTNDSKVEDHYAIIPTGTNLSCLSSLSDLEQKVYDLIVRRFVAIFLPPAEYKKVTVTWRDNHYNEMFTGSGSTMTKKGFTTVYDLSASYGTINPAFDLLKEGDVYESSYSIEKGKTTPPKRYTSGSMILAMENAGNLIEEEELREQIKAQGIGTSATRADTIKKLVRINDLSLNTKTQVLTPTAFGEAVYEAVKEMLPDLLNPKLTAEWEQHLNAIADGTTDVKAYRKDFESFVSQSVEEIKEKPIHESVKNLAKNIKEDKKNKPAPPKKSEIGTYLSVPFSEKDEAKGLGARWDSSAKCWYMPAGADQSKFKKWITGNGTKTVKKIYIKVSFDEKDEAKKLGAKWDGDKKSWYIMSNQDKALFSKWVK